MLALLTFNMHKISVTCLSSVLVFLCLFVCLFTVCLFVCLQFVCLFVYSMNGMAKNYLTFFFFFFFFKYSRGASINCEAPQLD